MDKCHEPQAPSPKPPAAVTATCTSTPRTFSNTPAIIAGVNTPGAAMPARVLLLNAVGNVMGSDAATRANAETRIVRTAADEQGLALVPAFRLTQSTFRGMSWVGFR